MGVPGEGGAGWDEWPGMRGLGVGWWWWGEKEGGEGEEGGEVADG